MIAWCLKPPDDAMLEVQMPIARIRVLGPGFECLDQINFTNQLRCVLLT
jgi:hypothetical protein